MSQNAAIAVDVKELAEVFLKSDNPNLKYLFSLKERVLEQDFDFSKKILTEIFRHFHTLKGNGLALGFNHIAHLCELSESLIKKIQNDQIKFDAKSLELLFKSIDRLKIIFDRELNELKNKKQLINYDQQFKLKAKYDSDTIVVAGENILKIIYQPTILQTFSDYYIEYNQALIKVFNLNEFRKRKPWVVVIQKNSKETMAIFFDEIGSLEKINQEKLSNETK